MLIVTGTALVLGTWTLFLAALALLGLPLAAATSTGHWTAATLRRSLWWGLLVVALGAVAVNLCLALASGATASLLALFVLLCGLWAAWRWTMSERGRRPTTVPGTAGLSRLLAVASGLAIVTLAVAALGPLTNTDSGLYHLGAIRYSADFTAITGLSNLYGPLGYSTAEFPLAALLSNGPWGDNGVRLLNGVLLVMVLVDLVLRSRRRRLTAGFYVELVGAVVLLVPMLALADFWITSPTQDGAVFALTVVATGYLADALARGKDFPADAGVLGVLGILMVMIRPTMGVFAAAVVVVLIVRGWRLLRATTICRLGPAVTAVMVGGILAAVLTGARDYRLSGWLLYPLSILPFDVPWRAGDPTELREATLGYHRNPDDLWGSVTGWDWLGPWFARLPGQWETWLLAVLILVAVLLLLLKPRVRTPRWRSLALCLAPSAVAAAAWFALSPPSFRFGWGPVLTLGSIPVGWMLWRRSIGPSGGLPWARLAVGAGATLLALAAVVTLVGRTEWSTMTEKQEWTLGPLSVPYSVTSLPDVPVEEVPLDSGLTLLVPEAGEQCWGVFPLCTPRVDPRLRPLGATFADGLLP